MNTGSLLYRPCAPDELRHLVRRHFGPTALARASLLEGGLWDGGTVLLSHCSKSGSIPSPGIRMRRAFFSPVRA